MKQDFLSMHRFPGCINVNLSVAMILQEAFKIDSCFMLFFLLPAASDSYQVSLVQPHALRFHRCLH